jgi:hypothetical protein
VRGSRLARAEALARALQAELVSLLFDKIPEYFQDEEEGGALLESVPRLILGQLKWMECVQPESNVTARLIELIEVAPLHLKRESLGVLPEVALDNEHQQVVDALKQVRAAPETRVSGGGVDSDLLRAAGPRRRLRVHVRGAGRGVEPVARPRALVRPH